MSSAGMGQSFLLRPRSEQSASLNGGAAVSIRAENTALVLQRAEAASDDMHIS